MQVFGTIMFDEMSPCCITLLRVLDADVWSTSTLGIAMLVLLYTASVSS